MRLVYTRINILIQRKLDTVVRNGTFLHYELKNTKYAKKLTLWSNIFNLKQKTQGRVAFNGRINYFDITL